MARGLMILLGCAILGVGTVAAVRSEDGGAPEPVAVTTTTPEVREWACPAGTVGRVNCAYIDVPQDHDDPAIERIRLFTATIRPPSESAGPPVVFVGDELGGITVEQFGAWHQVARSLQRQIILVDQRGSGRSAPHLSCPQLGAVEWLESDLRAESLDTVRTQLHQSVANCRTNLDEEIPLEAYSLEAIVADLDRVREVLGIERWIVAGAGEATVIARSLEAAHPDTVEGLILLGATPEPNDPYDQRETFADEVLSRVAGPVLSARLDQVTEPLDERSFVFAVTSDGRTRRVAVGQGTVAPTLARAVGDPDVRAALETLIDDRLADGQWRAPAALRGEQYRVHNGWAAPLAFNVVCGAVLSDTESPEPSDHWTGLLDDPTLDPQLCDAWDQPAEDAPEAAPARPTLVVNGALDIAAPASAAKRISSHWSTAAVYTLTETGRPSPFDPCVVSLMSGFVQGATPTMEEACP